MNFLRLEYFVEIARVQNLSKAAANLFITQQSLSEQVKKLENEIGTPLLIRKRPLELTAAGEILASGAEKILSIWEQTQSEIAGTLSSSDNTIRIAISPFEAPPLLSSMISHFMGIYPNAEIEVVKRQKHLLLDEIEGISFYFDFPPLSQSLDHIYLIHNDFNCVVFRESLLRDTYPEDWEARLSLLKETGDLGGVRKLPFALLKGRTGKLSDFAIDVFKSFRLEPNTRIISDNGAMNASMCLDGKAAMIGSLFYERSRYFEQMPLRDNPLYILPLRTRRGSLPIALSYQAGKQFSFLESCFVRETQNVISRHVEKFKEIYGEEENEALFY